jgi:EAL domain-containing protein (putative c-di-GMP-specific phosphodiesterase class I)
MGELRHAIESDELILHYQPKTKIKTGKITEVEALVRWQHPQHDLMPPDEFIPLAERTGLIKPLTTWVLNHALRQHSIWREQGLDIGVAVNMSAHGLLDLELPDLIAGVLASHNAAPDRLVLEITETSIMVDQERALQILTRLADMGVRLSIDDFGTGYSSLAYLSKLPVREIKIDKSFVMDMNENEKHAMIVRATIDLAHNLGLEVIAEGTCTKEVFVQLESLNCDAAQGNYISPPISAEEFERWRNESERRPKHAASEKAGIAQLIDTESMSGTRMDDPSLIQDPELKAEESAANTKIRDLENYIGQLDGKLKRSGG